MKSGFFRIHCDPALSRRNLICVATLLLLQFAFSAFQSYAFADDRMTCSGALAATHRKLKIPSPPQTLDSWTRDRTGQRSRPLSELQDEVFYPTNLQTPLIGQLKIEVSFTKEALKQLNEVEESSRAYDLITAIRRGNAQTGVGWRRLRNAELQGHPLYEVRPAGSHHHRWIAVYLGGIRFKILKVEKKDRMMSIFGH